MKGNELSQNILTKMISGPVDSNYHENYVFQLTKVEKNYQGKNMAICSMSDGVYESPHMFLMKGDDIKRFNIVQVSNITKKKSNMVFLVVKSYSIVNDKISKLIGNPTLFNSENGINPIEKLQTASKNKKQIKQNTNLSNTMTKNSEDEAFRYFSKFHDIDSVTESFTILVRVVRKTVIDYENKQKEKGKMAKIIFVDMDGVEVEIVIYKKLFEVIEPKFEDGKIYQISRVNPCPNDNRRIGDSPDFIFFFNKQSDIKEINDVYINKKMPHSGRPKLVNIEHIGKFKKFDEIDILCFILDNKPIEEKKNKNGEDMKLKKITIATSCGNKTDIAFFGEKAEEIECMNFEKNDILLIKKYYLNDKLTQQNNRKNYWTLAFIDTPYVLFYKKILLLRSILMDILHIDKKWKNEVQPY